PPSSFSTLSLHDALPICFSFGDALLAVSRKFPADKFVIIDYDYNGVKPAPTNVQGNDFMPNQPSYLAGIVAAGVSKSQVIGFVGDRKSTRLNSSHEWSSY